MADTTRHRFTWGQTVRLKSNPYLRERVGLLAEVCGVLSIQTSEHAERVLGGSVGGVAYLVEFGDGASFEVVGDILEAE